MIQALTQPDEEQLTWRATWTQALTDFREDGDEEPFDNTTIRMTVTAAIGGTRVRVELSNAFGDAPVRIGHGAIGAGGKWVDFTFAGSRSMTIPTGGSIRSDPLDLVIAHGQTVDVELFIPEATPYTTGNGFRFQRADRSGDLVGARAFQSTEHDTGLFSEGLDWSLPSGGPFLRAIDVAGIDAAAVIVCLGASITTMGWPQLAAAKLPAAARISVVNRGIPGNRLRFDAPTGRASFGRSGLSRFENDVRGTAGVTHVLLAHASNDIGLPGELAPISELPSAADQINAYRQLIDSAHEAGLEVLLATITPMTPDQASDVTLESVRVAVNEWIRTSGHVVVDSDELSGPGEAPAGTDETYDVGDHQHPNITGQNRLAQAVAETISRITSHVARDREA